MNNENPNLGIQDGYPLSPNGNADFFADRIAGHLTYDGLGWYLDGRPIPEKVVAILVRRAVNARLAEYIRFLGDSKPRNWLEKSIREGTICYLTYATDKKSMADMLKCLKYNPKIRMKNESKG